MALTYRETLIRLQKKITELSYGGDPQTKIIEMALRKIRGDLRESVGLSRRGRSGGKKLPPIGTSGFPALERQISKELFAEVKSLCAGHGLIL